VEATTLNERTFSLWPQDRFIRDNIRSNDILIVSVGGNDVALCPTPCTIVSILCLLSLPFKCIENGISIGAVPVRSTPSDEFLATEQFLIMCFCAAQCNDCCCGCGPSLLSCAGTCPPCLGYFRHLFGTRYVLQKRGGSKYLVIALIAHVGIYFTSVQKYIEALTAKTKPKKILVCMIYYPEEAPTPSWAGPALGVLGYNSNPAKLQMLIRKAYDEAIRYVMLRLFLSQ
jgi:hypothetical protein